MRKFFLVAMIFVCIGCSKTNQKHLLEGRRIECFYIEKQGMAFSPHYTMVKDGTKIIWKQSNQYLKNDNDEIVWEEAKILHEGEHGELFVCEDDVWLSYLEQQVEKCGALTWDGFNKKRKDNTLDSGTKYEMVIQLSDHTVISMQGYNICPDQFETLWDEVQTIFESLNK